MQKLKFYIEEFLNKKFSMFYTVIIREIVSPDGKIISSKKQIGKSVNTNFLNSIYAGLSANGSNPGSWSTNQDLSTAGQVRALAGAYFNISYVGNLFNYGAGDASNDITGIILSTDTSPVHPLNYALTHKISHGGGGGQLSYQNSSSTGVSVTGQTSTLQLLRTWLNISGGDVSPTKIFIVPAGANLGNYCQVYEDLITPADVIPTSHGYNVAIQFQITT